MKFIKTFTFIFLAFFVLNISSINAGNIIISVKHNVYFNGNGATGGSTATQSIVEGATASLNANGFTKTGYSFNGWNTNSSGTGTNYGNTANYTMGTSDATLYAVWGLMTGTLTASANSCLIPAYGNTCNINFSWNTINPIGISTLTKTPTSYYNVQNSNSGNNVALTMYYGSNVLTLSNNNINLASKTVTASCGTGYSWKYSGWGGYKCRLNTYNILTSVKTNGVVSGIGGSISPTSKSASYGTTTSFTITPNAGYSTSSVTGCGGSLSGTTYTTGTITNACTVTASFNINSYTVSTSAGTGGSISPTSKSVSYGSTTSFTISPNTGYLINTVSGCSGSLSGSIYTTGAITNACTVSATFKYMTGSFTGGNNCTIAPGASTCSNINLDWNTVNPIGTSKVTTNYPSSNSTVRIANSGVNIDYAIPNGSRTFYLYNNGTQLASKTVSASCGTGAWNGSSCNAALTNPNLKVTLWSGTNLDGPTETYTGNTYTLSWGAVSNASSCTLDGVSASTSGGTKTGTATARSKTFTLNCVNSTGQSASDTLTITTPPIPTSLVSSCSADAMTATINWVAPSSYNTFYTRATNPAGTYVLYDNAVVGKTDSFPVQPNTGYNIWIHTKNTTNGAWSSSVPSYINCARIHDVSTSVLTNGVVSGTGGSISPISKTVNYNTTTTFTITPNAGYTASASGCGGSLSGTTYTTGTITNACTVTANFSINSYNITFNGNGATGGSTATESFNYNQTKALTANGFIKTGFSFKGWATSLARASNGTIDYTNTANYKMGTSNANLYAVWGLMIGTLTASNCNISSSGNTCNTNLVWSTTNPIGTSAVTTNYPTSNTTVKSANLSTGTTYAIPEGTTSFYLYNNGILLATSSATGTRQTSPTPTGLSTTVGANCSAQIGVSWNTSVGATSYTLRDGTNIIYTGVANSYSHTGLSISSSHSYTVRANNSGGSSSYSISVKTNAPSCTHTVTFNGNTNTGGSTATQSIVEGATATLNANGFTKTGFSFKGWATSSAGTIVVFNDKANYKMGTSNATLYAKWSINSYTVSTSAGTGGSISPTSKSVSYGSTTSFTISPNTGYLINTVSGCSGSLSGSTYTTGAITNACTVTASFSTNSYSITFNSAGGTAVATKTQPYGSTVTAPINPTRSGWTFTGWSPALASTMPVGGQALTATWSDTTPPTYNSTTFTGCNYLSGNNCYVKSGTTFYTNVSHTDNESGTNRQYLEYSKNGLNRGTWNGATGNIKSYATSYGVNNGSLFTGYGEGTGMTGAGYLDIQSATCIQPGNCNTTAVGKWKTVAGSGASTMYGVTVYMYDKVSNGVGYTTTNKYVYLDNTTPTITNITASPATAFAGTTVRFYVDATDASSGLNTTNALFYFGTTPYSSWNRVSGATMSWDGSRYYYDVVLNDPAGTTYRAWSYVYDKVGNRAQRDENPTEFTIKETIGSIAASNCTIPVNGASCNSSLSWTTTNPIGTSAVTTPTSITVGTGNSGTSTYSLSYGNRAFYLYNNSKLLASKTATASCGSNIWNGSKCVPSNYQVSTSVKTNGVVSGVGGTITPTSKIVGYNTSTTFTISPTTGYTSSASGCGGTLLGTTYTTGAITSSCTVIANFSITSNTLTVSKSGSGSVSSSPVGISCGSNCSSPYTYGTSVTLTATPSTGYKFTGWGGVCSGTGSCVVLMVAAKSVSASFALMTGSLTASNCTIPVGQTTCNTNLVWNTINPIGTSAVTTNYPSVNTTVLTANSSSGKSYAIPEGTTNFFLYNNGIKLATASATVVQDISVTLTASPVSMYLPTNESTLTWSTTGSPTNCTATNDWTGTPTPVPSGNVLRSGMIATTYHFGITCSKIGVTNATDFVDVIVNPRPNITPTIPTITADTGTFYTGRIQNFTFLSTDGDLDPIRYEIDWNNDGIVDTSLPSSSTYVASGTSQTTTYSWSSIGTYTIKARSLDKQGAYSGWNSFIANVVQMPPPPVITYKVNGVVNGGNTIPMVFEYNGKATIEWVSTGSTSCTLTKGITTLAEGVSNSGYITPPLTHNAVYKIKCLGIGGPTIKNMSFNVGKIKPIFKEL